MKEPYGRHVSQMIRTLGYALTVELNDDRTATVTAVDGDSGERFVCTAPGDGFASVCELARMVGIDLDA